MIRTPIFMHGNVKLVSEVGVGTVAAGVAKAKADVILISVMMEELVLPDRPFNTRSTVGVRSCRDKPNIITK